MNAPLRSVTAAGGLMSKITRGKLTNRPIRVLLYGAEGIGKSTFGAGAPNPIFLCAEDGTAQLDVARLPEPTVYQDVVNSIGLVANDEHEFQTLVIDTLDWLEPLVWMETCKRHNKKDVEAFGYGKGYVAALEVWRELILLIQACCLKRKMHLVVLSHSTVRRIDDTITQAHDQQTLKIHEKAAGLWAESVDAVLYGRVEIFTSLDERTKKHRAFGNGSRVVYTTPTAGYRAKNRYGLPDQIPLDWAEIEKAARSGTQADPAAVRVELEALLPQLPADMQTKLRKFLDGAPSIDALLITLDKTRTYAATNAAKETK